MITFVKSGTVPDNKKTWKFVVDKKDHFEMGRNITINKPLLYWKLENDNVL